MLMRYYWGFAPGHVYTHGSSINDEACYTLTDQSQINEDIRGGTLSSRLTEPDLHLPDQSLDVVAATLLEGDLWNEDDDIAEDPGMGDDNPSGSESDSEALALHEMYGN